MNGDHAGLHAAAFSKADCEADSRFYAQPRFVEHLDGGAIRAVTSLYRTMLPEDGVILDLMSSWVSHLPAEMSFDRIIGHGMNQGELAANERLDDYFIQDLNQDSSLKLADHCLDAALICVSVQYLQVPVAVYRELARTLRPGAPVVVTFSDRCFPTKAVAIWQALDGPDRQRLVALLMSRAGLSVIETREFCPDGNDPDWRDPIYAVIGRTPTDR